jgi:RNA polymerase sigma factor (sigma-70 family)
MGFAMTKPPITDPARGADNPRLQGEAAIPLPVDWRDVSERLRRYALALTRRADQADDLVQQTLANLLAKAPDKAGHVGYARSTLTRLFLDRERSIRRRVARTLRVAWPTSIPRAPGTDPAEGSVALHAAIEALPARQRAALVLRLVEELDYPQIGAALGCSPEAVRSSLHLARRAVRRAIEAETGSGTSRPGRTL